MSKEHLSIYLNDHLAGANFALELLDHLATENPDLKTSLTVFKKEIDEDREQLKMLMARLGVTESRVRKAGTWLAESLTEVKLDVDDDPHGPLRRLERLEALGVGIDGKIALWQAMEAAPRNDGTSTFDFELLTRRGREQRSRVEVLRLQAARVALAS